MINEKMIVFHIKKGMAAPGSNEEVLSVNHAVMGGANIRLPCRGFPGKGVEGGQSG
jgi:hypothetical protein